MKRSKTFGESSHFLDLPDYTFVISCLVYENNQDHLLFKGTSFYRLCNE